MRSRLIAGVVAAASVCVAAGPARAGEIIQTQFAATGHLEVRWHGARPACAAAGMCGYRGAIRYGAGRRARLDRIRFGHRPIDLIGFLDMRDTTRATAGWSSASEMCRTEGAFPARFELGVRRAYRGRYRVSVDPDSDPWAIATGQCPGPRTADFAGSLPSAVFSWKRIRRQGGVIALAGRFGFLAGPIRGTVISTLRLTSRRTRTERIGGGTAPEPSDGPRQLFVELDYRVRRLAGALTARFHGVPGRCVALGACGSSGRDRFTANTSGDRLRVIGVAPLKGRLPKLHAAIRRAARYGLLFGYARVSESGRTVSSLMGANQPPCRDTFTPPAPLLSLFANRLRFAELSLDDEGGETIGAGPGTVLEGRCGGPTQHDVLAGFTLARRRFSVDDLLARRLHLVLGGAHAFNREAYAGRYRAHVDVVLVRTHARRGVQPTGHGGQPVVIDGRG